MKILIVEDEQTNVKLLRFYVDEYFKSSDISEFTIDVAQNGLEAIGFNCINQYDIMLLDVKMPKFDGLEVLNTFKSNKNLHKPFISMITSMGEDKYKNLFRLLGANSYIIKPFNKNRIFEVIEKVYELKNSTNNTIENIQEKKVINHKKISAKEFLKDLDNLSYMLEEIDELLEISNEIVLNLDLDNFKIYTKNIQLALNKYARLFNSLFSLNKLSTSLDSLNQLIATIDLKQYDELKSNYIVELIRAIFEDIAIWKELLFLKQDIDDVYYINETVINHCKEFEELIGVS
jgi:DNA-binding response OmpR family regulator